MKCEVDNTNVGTCKCFPGPCLEISKFQLHGFAAEKLGYIFLNVTTMHIS